MRQMTDLILSQFVSLLLADYERWASGTRDELKGVGSLLPMPEGQGDAQ
jgi:hypothetical protein